MHAIGKRIRIGIICALSGGSLMVLQGCNPNVRDTILTGVESAASGLAGTFIQAFFEGLAQEDDPTNGVMVI